jgi:RNA polymerase sigma-70 factor, ECF subfamily
VGGGTPSGPASRRVGFVSDDDREAVRRVQAGDTEAFEPLVEKYKRKVFRLAYQVLRDQEEALDVSQEAFVKAFRALPAFKGDSAFYTWLFRITMNVALDRKRQRATRAKSLGAEDVPPEEWERTATSTDPSPEDVATGVERRERIRKGLDSLSEHHRTIVILSDIEGLQYREIAEVLGIPMGTVMSRLHHARKRLREVLGTGFALLLAALTGLLVVAGRAGPGSAAAAAGSPTATHGGPGWGAGPAGLRLRARDVRVEPPGGRLAAGGPARRSSRPCAGGWLRADTRARADSRPGEPGPAARRGACSRGDPERLR